MSISNVASHRICTKQKLYVTAKQKRGVILAIDFNVATQFSYFTDNSDNIPGDNKSLLSLEIDDSQIAREGAALYIYIYIHVQDENY